MNKSYDIYHRNEDLHYQYRGWSWPFRKTFKENLYRGGGVLKIGSPLLILPLNVFLQHWLLKSNHRTPPAQLIWIKICIKGWYKQNNKTTKTISSIKTRRPIKNQQALVEQQPDTETNVTKVSDVWLINGDDDMVQHIRPINKSGPQEIFALWRK